MDKPVDLKILILCICAFTACEAPTQNSPSTHAEDTVKKVEHIFTEPVEKHKPHTDYPSAIEGQTRAPGVKTASDYTVTVLTEKLDRPWAIINLPDGRFLITEKSGYMLAVSREGEIGEKITGLPQVDNKGQGGLLDVVLDPGFEENRMLYWTFAQAVKGGNLTAVAKGRWADDESHIENAEVIYQAGPAYDGSLHYGSRIVFDKSGNLIFSTGERSDLVTRPQAQDLSSNLGKVIRITVDGKPVSDNPFIGREDALPEIYTYGHRNTQSLAYHPVTGVLWQGEFGAMGGDEINILQAGKNYGWPTITYGLEYSGATIGEGLYEQDGLEQPVYYWDPSISFSGMTFYDSDAIPEWENNLFLGCLAGQHIARLVIDENKVIGEERLLEDEHQRFRDLVQGPDNAIYAVTDQGRLYRIGK